MGLINQIHNILPCHLIICADINHPMWTSAQFLLQHPVKVFPRHEFRVHMQIGRLPWRRLTSDNVTSGI